MKFPNTRSDFLLDLLDLFLVFVFVPSVVPETSCSFQKLTSSLVVDSPPFSD